jgi:predicted nucleic acid-binding protein
LNVYVDPSVLLRIVLGEPDRLRSWSRIEQPISSELTRLECLRTIDRARIQFQLDEADVARRRAAVLDTIETFGIVPVTVAVLERAAEPFPTLIGSLDAIHLASGLLVRQTMSELVFATHDIALGRAARAVGFTVEGVEV